MRLLLFNLATDVEDPVLGFTTKWISALARQCDAIDVITMRAGQVTVPANVDVYSVGKERGFSKPWRALEFYRILSRLLRSRRYDACLAHMMPLFAVMGAPMLKMRGIPTTLWYAHKSVTPLLWLAERVVDAVVTPTPESFRLASRKVIITGHGIDVEQFVPRPASWPREERFTVISVGRIAPVKQLETLIEAARQVVAKHRAIGLRIRLVGNVSTQDADYARGLRRRVSEAGLERAIEFVGPVRFDEIAEEYWRADVFVSLSETGSADKAVLEAMSCGVPVVTSNEAFSPLLAEWSELLIVPKRSPAALAQRLTGLALQTRTERASLGIRLREKVIESHSLQHLAQRLVTEVLPPTSWQRGAALG